MINVISSNIRFDNPNDGEHQWKFRLPHLADLLNKKSPDILGTQEGWEPQLRELHSKLNDLEIIDSHRNWIADRMYPTIFLNSKKFNLLRSGDIWLSETPYTEASKSFNSAFPRLCTWCEAEYKENNKRVLIINVHLDHLETATRQQQIKVLIKEIRAQSKEENVILMGDFNEAPNEEVRKILNNSELNLIDPWIEEELPEEPSHHSFKGKRDDGSRIDWILHSESFTSEKIKLLKDHFSGIYPSDHFPVFTQLTFNNLI